MLKITLLLEQTEYFKFITDIFMGKLNVKYNKRENSFLITNRIKYPEVINQKIYNMLKARTYEGFLRTEVSKHKDNKKAILICKITQMVQLSTYLNKQLGRDQFLDIIIQIIDCIKTCENNLLNINNIELNDNCIFVEPNSKKIYCIYWPLVNNKSYIPAGEFFKNLLGKVTLFTNEPIGFLTEYKNFFESIDAFSLTSFEKLIYGFRGKRTQKISICPDSNELEKSRKLSNLDNKKIDDMVYNPLDNVRKFVNLSSSSNKSDDINSNYRNNELSLFLIQKSNGKKNKINGINVVIGKDSKRCDFVISGNNAISRVHATIKKINDDYCLIDKNSTNHTFINGAKLDPEKQYIVRDGDIVKFANEEFECFLTR